MYEKGSPMRPGDTLPAPPTPRVGCCGVWPWAWLPLISSRGPCSTENPAASMVAGEVGLGCPCNGGRGGNRAGLCQALRPKVRGALFSLFFLNPSLDSPSFRPSLQQDQRFLPRNAGCIWSLSFCRLLWPRKSANQ